MRVFYALLFVVCWLWAVSGWPMGSPRSGPSTTARTPLRTTRTTARTTRTLPTTTRATARATRTPPTTTRAPPTSTTQDDVIIRSMITVPTKPCSPGHRRDSIGICRKVFR